MNSNPSIKWADFRDFLTRFFGGRLYPLSVVILVLIGHALGLEVITNLINIILVGMALALTSRVRVLMPYLMSVIFQVSRINAPGVPSFSDHYVTGWRLPVIILSFLFLALAFGYYIFKNRIYRHFRLRDLFLWAPLLLFSLALLLGGAFSPQWEIGSLGYGALLVLYFVLPFFLFYYGLADEEGDSAEYLSYNAALVALLLVLEVALVYLFGGVIVDGEIVKENIVFGFGVWNSMGVAIAQLIPLIFIGVVRSRSSHLYFAASLFAMVGILLTMSRGAWLFGAVAFVLSELFAALYSRRRLFHRIFLASIILVCLLGVVFMWDKLPSLLAAFFNDNGRFTLWQIGIDNFLTAPIFGTGFFAFKLPDLPGYFVGADFIPAFAHQTFVELLSATGIFGLLSYLLYRASTVMPLFRRPTVTKALLFGSVLVMLGMSLLDNFLFSLWPTLTYSIALAVMHREDVSPRSEL